MHRDDEQNKLCFAVLSLGSRSWERFGFAFQEPKQRQQRQWSFALLHVEA